MPFFLIPQTAAQVYRVRATRAFPILLPLAALLAMPIGCATSPDPHDGGFVSGVVGIAGGGYERRIDEREQSYRGELDTQARLKAEAQALERERAAVRSDLSRAKARLAAQEQRIAHERSRIQAASRRSAADQAQLARLKQAQSRIDETKRSIQEVNPNEQPVPDLKAQTRGIQLDLDEIDSMVGVVSGT